MRLRLSNAQGFTLNEAVSERVATIENADADAGPEVAIVSDSGSDLTYGEGDTIRVRLGFGEAVAVDTAGGAPRLKVAMGADDGERWALYESGGGTEGLVFAYGPVAAPDRSRRGIAVLGDSLELGGGAIASAATGTAAAIGHPGLDHDPAHKVDHAAPVDEPAVAEAAIVAYPGPDGVYTKGEALAAAVTFDAAVRVRGTPTLALIADGWILRAG